MERYASTLVGSSAGPHPLASLSKMLGYGTSHPDSSPEPPSSFTLDEDDDDDSDTMSLRSSSTRSVTTCATTVDWEMRSASRPPSVFSMTSSMRALAYRHEYGRGINNYSDVYRLPADEEELARLDKQHELFAQVMGKYPPPMDEVLANAPGETKTCVDLGCGSGSWIVDVAQDYPHISAVAVDLVPLQVVCDRDMPLNCRSEVDDINLGLQHFQGDFNVVHVRLISSGIRDYKRLIDDIALTVRPAGLIDLTEFDFRVYGPDKKPLTEDASSLAKWMHLASQAVKQQGGEPEAANYLQRWVSGHGAFEEVVYRRWWFQTSPWNPGQDLSRPLLLGSGLPEHVVNHHEDAASRELLEGIVPGYILVENVYARKKP
ncbi:hypothetical protein NM688_g597 [Phlebia brevispora]|uniref:Uncharacterized protein n=1 Tax=Phlebia brevispora TaxID=194682 RepID=A0ACC1TDK3_9APHY|nr:hypothetical protein NM688_g597 [Phlebia brevispora]